MTWPDHPYVAHHSGLDLCLHIWRVGTDAKGRALTAVCHRPLVEHGEMG